VVKKVTKKTFVRINLLVRASPSPLYAALLLAAAHLTAQLLADAPSHRQNSYRLVWLRHDAYGGRVALFMDVACRWLVTGDEVTGNRISCVVCVKSYISVNLHLCVPVFIFSVVGNRISCVANSGSNGKATERRLAS